MKLPILCFCLYRLFPIAILVAANLDQELRTSVDAAMKCRSREPPKGPVMAVTPSRFVQVVVVMHERFKTPSCVRTSKSPISVSDERTWPFCVFGRCNQGRCQCAGHFVGPKCSTYSKKCWLMYCYLTSCHPAHQSLHCVCDPSLYGTKISTGVYWYDEGKSSKYIPPPSGWEDEPTSMIKLKGNSAIEIGQNSYSQDSSGIQNSGRGSNAQNAPGRARNQGGAFGRNMKSPPRKNSGGKNPDLASKANEGKGGSADTEENGDEVRSEKQKKTDVEEALEELEYVSTAAKPNHGDKLHVLLCVAFCMRWMFLI